MPAVVRRSRRLSAHTLPDSLDQCIPGGFNYLAIGCPQPPIGCPIAKPVSFASTLSPEDIESLSAFADQRELPPLDLHSRPKGKNGNAPRPPNAFMLFRSDFWKFNKDTIPERDHREISRITARCWNVLAKHRRLPYQDQAKKLKEEHALLYPQHKYNLSAKDRARKKPKQEIDGHDLCDLLAARVARDVKASRSPEDSGSSESGLLDQVMEQKVKSKRSRSASAAFGAEEAFEGKSQSLKPPAKKRKRDHHNSSTGAVQVPKIQPQTGISHPSISSFVPTNEIPALALPPSHKSPVAKGEPLQDQVPTVAAQTVTVKNEPALWGPKIEASEPQVQETPAPFSPQYPLNWFQPPVEYLEKPTDAVIGDGLQLFENYFGLGVFESLGDTSGIMGMVPQETDEFSLWCNNYR